MGNNELLQFFVKLLSPRQSVTPAQIVDLDPVPKTFAASVS
jgi:hypothetical protein